MRYISILIFLSLLAGGCQENKQQKTESSVDEMHTISTTIILPDTARLSQKEQKCPFYYFENFQDLFTNHSLLQKSSNQFTFESDLNNIQNNFHFKKQKNTNIVEIEFRYSNVVQAEKLLTIHLDNVLDSIHQFNRAEVKSKLDFYLKRFNEIGDSINMSELEGQHPELGSRFTYFAEKHSEASIEYAGIINHIKVLDPPHIKK